MVDYLPVRRLAWDAWNVEHLAKHAVTQSESEVETVIDNDERRLVLIETYKGRFQVLGQSASGRILSVIIGPDRIRATGTFYVFSARPAPRKERLLYHERMEESTDGE